MKKLIFALALALTAALQAGTWTDESTGITWSYSITNNQATVERRPGWNWQSWTKTDWPLVVPEKFEGAAVVAIGEYAFTGGSITDITLPSTVKTVSAAAFMDSQLKTLALPSGVTSIGPSAYRRCQLLDRSSGNPAGYVLIPSSVKSIGNCAFAECPKLKQLSIAKDCVCPDNVITNCATNAVIVRRN